MTLLDSPGNTDEFDLEDRPEPGADAHERDVDSMSAEGGLEEDEDLPSMPDGLPSVPRAAAVKKLAEGLKPYVLSEGAALALARAVARPEEARRRLQAPDLMRVPGGTLETISVQVWLPAVTTFPVNNREASARVYPLSGALREDQYPPLGPISAPEGVAGELSIAAQSPAHVVSALDWSNAYLERVNDLSTTIGQHGVLRDLLLSVVRIEHTDGAPPSWILGAADGSSRVSAAHRLHDLKAEEVVYQLPQNERRFRGLIGDVIADAQRPIEQVAESAVKRTHALVAPATVVLRFVPDSPARHLRYDQAIRFIVGITHVEPPKAWGKASENDALGDAVIEEFVDGRRITSVEGRWYRATISPAEADQEGFDRHLDTRVAEIAARFLPDSAHKPFRRGVLRITAKSRVNREFKTQIATELALRPWRSTQPESEADAVKGARSTLQRTLLWPALREDGWRRTTNDPDLLLTEALRELASTDGSMSGPSGVELAVRGGYYLAIHRRLRREVSTFNDKRAPYAVLQRMTESEHGLRTLHAAVVEGRADRVPVQVDGEGSPIRSSDGSVLLADNRWLRLTFSPADEVGPVFGEDVDTPETTFARERRRVSGLVDSLESTIRVVAEIPGRTTRKLVREQGWPSGHAEDLANRLMKISGDLRFWASFYEAAEEAENEDVDEEFEDVDDAE
ncbi:hypothetical protein [Micromonospora sp. NPDC051006]|uniref:hypothetical protein n=1 Tax=Micromonospora sp. NPDC051006 TaxID=3364283 RepID=UPI0037B8AC76